jgi:hypothetical protein
LVSATLQAWNWYQRLGSFEIGVSEAWKIAICVSEAWKLRISIQKLGAQWNWSQKLRSFKIYFRSLELVSQAEKLGICIRKLGILEPRNWCQKLGSLKLVYQKLRSFGIGFQKLGTQHSARRE